MNVVRRQKSMRTKKELTSLLLTKAEETETANVNAAWAKMKDLEAKLEADELEAMNREDLDSEIWNMLAERNKVQAKLQAFERTSMAQDDTLEKAKEEGRERAMLIIEEGRERARLIVHRWVNGLARKKQNKENDGELVQKKHDELSTNRRRSRTGRAGANS